MKRKKSPIILVLCLLVFVGVGAFMNLPASTGPDQPQGAPPKTEDSNKVGADVAKELSKADKAKPAPSQPKPRTKGKIPNLRGDQPTILKMHYSQSKPKPSDTSTSAQWYTDESARNLPVKN